LSAKVLIGDCSVVLDGHFLDHLPLFGKDKLSRNFTWLKVGNLMFSMDTGEHFGAGAKCHQSQSSVELDEQTRFHLWSRKGGLGGSIICHSLKKQQK
jgi:hypothetical protein